MARCPSLHVLYNVHVNVHQACKDTLPCCTVLVVKVAQVSAKEDSECSLLRKTE